MIHIFTIFVVLSQMLCYYSTVKNTGHGSYFGNEYGGLCIATTKHPSPGLFIMERWKDIDGYEDLYQVSNMGRIRSLARVINKDSQRWNATRSHYYQGKILSPRNTNGYYKVSLRRNGETHQYLIHRLVADAFIPNPENKPEINHKDGNKTNNLSNNLEWVTSSENHLHAFTIGLKERLAGEKNGNAKVNEFQVRVLRKATDLENIEIAEIFGLSNTTVCNIRKHRAWKHIK